eukprot:gnl/MRDRNA2_/MRDRNA2_58937_c1_seq1.p1 gnl/MRDRNA2_/MRDRNA2_58937_c1~~gnl/MRDRNA2_/MRDRNA2_58937_c1_seq1.p1  ORF type:complete len:784 (+),score=121.83 gnl/MRDRNA2_/MRDRNA2_58937_c1_seq1:153-2504(+)
MSRSSELIAEKKGAAGNDQPCTPSTATGLTRPTTVTTDTAEDSKTSPWAPLTDALPCDDECHEIDSNRSEEQKEGSATKNSSCSGPQSERPGSGANSDSDSDTDSMSGEDKSDSGTTATLASDPDSSDEEDDIEEKKRKKIKNFMDTTVAHMPVDPLCGKCPRVSCLEELPVFPSKIRSSGPVAKSTWTHELHEIRIPTPPPPSRFSLDPHESFPTISNFGHTRMDCWTRHVAKYKSMSTATDAIGKHAKRLMRDQQEDLTVATLRHLGRKNSEDRTMFEVDFLRKYLCNSMGAFFSDMPSKLLDNVCRSLKSERFSTGDVIWELGDPAVCVYLLINGVVKLVQGSARDAGACKRGKLLEAPACVGAEDIFKGGFNEHFEFVDEEGRFRRRSVTVIKPVDMLTLDRETLQMIAAYRQEVVEDQKRALLHKYVPQAKSDTQLLMKTHFFAIEDFVRPKFLFLEHGTPSIDEARVYILVAGEVQLKQRGRFAGMQGPGALLGADVLHGIPYRHSCHCDSFNVQCLSILAKDYLEVVLKRTTLIDEPPQDVESKSEASKVCPRQIIKAHHDQIKAQDDANDLRALEWKKTQHRSHPIRKMPISPCKPFITPSTTGVVSHVDVSYPTECDLFPSAYRALIKQTSKISNTNIGSSEPIILGLKRMKPAPGKVDLTASKASLATVATTATWSSGGHQSTSSLRSRNNSSATGSVRLMQNTKGTGWPHREEMEEDISTSAVPVSVHAAGRTVLMLCKQAPRGHTVDYEENVTACIAKYSVWGASRTRGAG